MMPNTAELWQFLPWGYALTVLLEGPVLWFGLAPHHRPWTRIAAAFWLTACTYPIVVLVLPVLLAESGYTTYLAVAETFAPAAECLLFIAATHGTERPWTWRDLVAITLANLTSFIVGMAILQAIR